MKYLSYILMFITATGLAIIAYAMFAPEEPPLVYTGGDKVSPGKVKAGGWINVTRHYQISRGEKITLARRMKKGDCEIGCTIVDLLPSTIVAQPGDYIGTRALQIPVGCSPGVWRLEFQVEWQDRVGRTQITYSPVLEIEVIE